MDFCMCTLLAISSKLVSKLLFLSLMQSNGGVSWVLKIFLLILFGFFI